MKSFPRANTRINVRQLRSDLMTMSGSGKIRALRRQVAHIDRHPDNEARVRVRHNVDPTSRARQADGVTRAVTRGNKPPKGRR